MEKLINTECQIYSTLTYFPNFPDLLNIRLLRGILSNNQSLLLILSFAMTYPEQSY